MKQKLMNSIPQGMLGTLNNAQMKQLQLVLENNDEAPVLDVYEKATNKVSKKKMEQYEKILKLMDDGDWHKTA